MSVFCLVDDNHLLLCRIMWVSSLPHFCGSEDCQREGQYEIRLENGESVWGTQEERDEVLAALEAIHGQDEQAE